MSATGGAAVWAGLAVLARVGVARFGAIELMFLFAPLVIVPLGMELGRGLGCGGRLASIAQRIQPVAAALAVGAVWIAPGRTAATLACAWLMVCVLMAGAGVGDLISASWSAGGGPFGCRSGQVRATFASHTSTSARTSLVRVAVSVAYLDLAVGGAWLVASRWGMRPMGIQEPIGLLTAVHFHFAGFATAMIAAATLQFAESQGKVRWLRWVVALVIGTPYLVAAGFVISPALRMVAGSFLFYQRSGAGGFCAGMRPESGGCECARVAAGGGGVRVCGDGAGGDVCGCRLFRERRVDHSADGADPWRVECGGVLHERVAGMGGGE